MSPDVIVIIILVNDHYIGAAAVFHLKNVANFDLTHNYTLAYVLSTLAQSAVTTGWSPTITGIVSGRHTIETSYQKIFNQVMFSLKIVMTAASPVSGDITFTLPIAPNSVVKNGRFPIGRAILVDTGTAIFMGGAHIDHTNVDRVRIGYSTIAGSNIGESNISSSLPFTWTTGDIIFVNGSYIAE